jgi:hypothetical protein
MIEMNEFGYNVTFQDFTNLFDIHSPYVQTWISNNCNYSEHDRYEFELGLHLFCELFFFIGSEHYDNDLRQEKHMKIHAEDPKFVSHFICLENYWTDDQYDGIEREIIVDKKIVYEDISEFVCWYLDNYCEKIVMGKSARQESKITKSIFCEDFSGWEDQ